MVANFADAYFSNELGPVISLLTTQQSSDYSFVEDELITLTQAAEKLHRSLSKNAGLIPQQEYKEMRKTIEKCIPSAISEELRKRIQDGLSYANELTLRSRLAALFEDCSLRARTLILGELAPVEFAKRLGSTRNYLTHYSRKDEQVLSSIDEFVWYNARLRTLLRYLLLKQIGTPEDLAFEAINTNFG